MACQKCNSEKLASVGAKCSDLCNFETTGFEHHGYVPEGFGIGGRDYVDFTYCLDCGQIQGKFPIDFIVKYCPECNGTILKDDIYNGNFECEKCGAFGKEDELLDKPKTSRDLLTD